MTSSESDETTSSGDETPDRKHCETLDLETRTREEEWGEEAFRDAGEATFGSQ
ncbi:hypothetical protein [Halorussus amylolyticus]|uniref:hypothetical protein n=1 Tax=Halorussus amylolyticus TaxID=1126242 RepID=UPI00192F8D4B|nr:hypothetical protein [Halorussus amylolyticus]